MKFLANENIPKQAVELLGERGIDDGSTDQTRKRASLYPANPTLGLWAVSFERENVDAFFLRVF